MIRVYLDQNKWIDLARAATGVSQGRRFVNALEVARHGVSRSEVSFPLDLYRYWETSKRGRALSRNQLADTMIELSRLDTVALPEVVLSSEIDAALNRLFGAPSRISEPMVFGKGLRHIAGDKLNWADATTVPASLSASDRGRVRDSIDNAIEEALLRSGPEDHARAGVPLNSYNHAERFVAYEVSLAEGIAAAGIPRGRLSETIRMSDLRDIYGLVIERMLAAGVDAEEFPVQLGIAGLVRFIDDLPTRFVTNAMRFAKHAQRQQQWVPNDFSDIVALPIPAVYCDVLVTEKQWVHRLRQAGVPEKFGTTLISDVADLPAVIGD